MLDLKLIIKAEDRATAPLRRLGTTVDGIGRRIQRVGLSLRSWANNSSLENVRGRVEGVGRAWDNVSRRVTQSVFRITAAAGAGIFAFKRLFVDTAAKFERFQTILETLEGSSAGAKRAMDWVSDFATKTPYELDEVMDSFVKLRAYGMDPTKGLLTSLGDTSAAMGKQLSQAVEAIADAVTGENERLKEFGIKARQVGSRIVYEYTQNGKTMTAVADKNSREQIQAVLMAIFNEKYAGAMDKLSKTGEGMWSNMMDQATRFSKMVMERGPWDALKSRLADILGRVDRMAASGQLDKIADKWAGAFMRIIGGIDRLIFGYDQLSFYGSKLHTPGLIETLPDDLDRLGKSLKPVVDFFGGWGNTLGVVAAVIVGGPLIAGLGSLVLAMTLLGVSSSGLVAKMALLSFGPAVAAIGNFITALRAGYGAVAAFNLVLAANPIGLVVIGIAALAAGAYLIYDNWEPLGDFFSGLWDGIKSAFDAGWAYVSPIIDKLMMVASYTPVGLALRGASALGGYLSSGGTQAAGAAPAGAGTVFPQGGAGTTNANVQGFIGIHVTSDGRAEVKKATTNNPNLDLDVNSGMAMGGL